MKVKYEIGATDWRIEYLKTGIKPDDMGSDIDYRTAHGDKKLRELWNRLRDKVLPDFIRRNPGKRPFCFHRYDAPLEPVNSLIKGFKMAHRKRLGGAGQAKWEVLSYRPRFAFGLPLVKDFVEREQAEFWKSRFGLDMVPINPDDPPLFESEAAYLDRHGLLMVAEKRKLTEADFEPISIR
ncbi:MAG: hypothetical protein JRH18_08955 [Deltaproteobacteria bacterium]|nr:hypothetical protein [Deltaproteobacteria bacterium]MBW2151782.1 hypothetical protein [Deltaproteobacteria bacterium]